MKPLFLLALASLSSTPAFAVGRLADVTVIDRSTGETLAAHYHRGEWWVAGRPGARYAIHVRNTQGARLLAVTAVDGVNVITGDTARHDQSGYVFDPWAGYEIAGWRKSDAQIAAFEFTSIPRSYAARTGRPDNVGVIGVALFRERAPVARLHEERAFAAPQSSPVPTSPPAERQRAEGDASASADTSGRAANEQSLERAAPAPSLGTGHGRREDSYVTHVDFQRERTSPNEVIRIRYDSHANLVAMGIIRRPPPVRPVPQPFPGEPHLGYVPDP